MNVYAQYLFTLVQFWINFGISEDSFLLFLKGTKE